MFWKNPISQFFLLLAVVFISISGFIYWQRTTPQRISFVTPQLIETVKNSPKTYPQKISIPGANIELPIIPAKINGQTWEVTSKGVSYLISTPLPGEKGNSVLYGHNWTNLLGGLTKARVGDTVTIEYGEGKKLNFIIQYTIVVTPDQTSILYPTDDTRITIYTCTGFMDSKRFVVVAIPN